VSHGNNTKIQEVKDIISNSGRKEGIYFTGAFYKWPGCCVHLGIIQKFKGHPVLQEQMQLPLRNDAFSSKPHSLSNSPAILVAWER
jgi:hypothetical protein